MTLNPKKKKKKASLNAQSTYDETIIILMY